MSRRLLAGQRPGRPVAAPGLGMATGLPGGRPARRVIAVLLLGAAALDLSRCGVAVASARDAGPVAGLVVAGLAAAGLSLWTAHACGSRRRWPAWAALLIGAASGPQAAVSGFHPPYTIPDTASAALGILLAVAVLATAGRTRQTAPIGPTGPFPAGSCTSTTSIERTTTSNTSASGGNTSADADASDSNASGGSNTSVSGSGGSTPAAAAPASATRAAPTTPAPASATRAAPTTQRQQHQRQWQRRQRRPGRGAV